MAADDDDDSMKAYTHRKKSRLTIGCYGVRHFLILRFHLSSVRSAVMIIVVVVVDVLLVFSYVCS